MSTSPLPWRRGTKVFRTLYDADNKLIGMMDRPEDAALVVNLTQLGSFQAELDAYKLIARHLADALEEVPGRQRHPALVGYDKLVGDPEGG